MLDHEVNSNEESICPRCGGEAVWSYIDADETRVGISCTNCGFFSLLRSEFEAAQADRQDADPHDSGH